MITTLLKQLPGFVEYNGNTFQLIVTVDEHQTAILAYIMVKGPLPAMRDKWFNTFEDQLTKHLYKVEGIKTEMEFREAIRKTKNFLLTFVTKNLVISKPKRTLVV